jgi:photosystem II stability/assembly factor-like uncharacterized protein
LQYAKNQIYRTVDGGAHWALLAPAPGTLGVADVAGDPGRPDSIYASARNVLRSVDSGVSWTRLGSDPVVAGIDLAAAPDEPDTVYALGGTGKFAYSLDSGTTWTTPSNEGLGGTASEGLGGAVGNISVGTAAPDTIYAGTSTGAFRTEDRGAHWTNIGPYDEQSRVVLDPSDPQRLYVNTVQGCQRFFCFSRGDRSTDGGFSWSALLMQDGGPALATFVAPSIPAWLFGYPASVIGNPPFSRGDADGTLSPLPNAPTLLALVADALDPRIIHGAGYQANQPFNAVFESDDSGLTWIRTGDLSQVATVYDFAVDPTNPARMAVAGDFGVLVVSTDRGATWTHLDRNAGLNDWSLRSVIFSPDGRTLYAGSATAVYQYTFCDDCRGIVAPTRRPPGTLPERPAAP